VGKFINLHTHSEYSLQDSVVKISDLVEKIKSLGQNAVAITDHANVSAYFEFEEECLKQNIKPIFGCEWYCNFTYGEKSQNRHHLVMLAKNNEGVKEIQQLMVAANENKYYKPIVSYEELFKNTPKNVVVTSACSLGSVGQALIENDYQNALSIAEMFKNVFDDYYLELQMHPQYEDQHKVNNGILNISKELNLPLTVSSDIHILNKEDGSVRDIWKAISWKNSFENVHEKSPTLKSNAIFNDDGILELAEETNFDINKVKTAIKNTKKISDMCNAELIKYDKYIPEFNKHNEILKFDFFKEKEKKQKKLSDF